MRMILVGVTLFALLGAARAADVTYTQEEAQALFNLGVAQGFYQSAQMAAKGALEKGKVDKLKAAPPLAPSDAEQADPAKP